MRRLHSRKILFTKTSSLWIWPAGYGLLVPTLNCLNAWREKKRGRGKKTQTGEEPGHHWPLQELREVSKAVGKCHSFPPSSGLAPGKMIKQEHLASASQFSFPNHTVLREVMEFYAQKGPGVNFHPAWRSPSPWGGHLATTWIPSVAEVLYFQEVTYSSKWDIIIKEREKENRTLGLELFTLSADPLLNLGTSTFSPT